MKEKFSLLIAVVESIWNWLPKEAKVAIYMFGAVVLDQVAKQLTPELLTTIPVEYRLFAFNILEVLLVETAKRLKEQRSK